MFKRNVKKKMELLLKKQMKQKFKSIPWDEKIHHLKVGA